MTLPELKVTEWSVLVEKAKVAIRTAELRSSSRELCNVILSLDAELRKGRQTLPRTADGHINNCAVANGYPEAECQMCQDGCPDRGRRFG